MKPPFGRINWKVNHCSFPKPSCHSFWGCVSYTAWGQFQEVFWGTIIYSQGIWQTRIISINSESPTQTFWEQTKIVGGALSISQAYPWNDPIWLFQSDGWNQRCKLYRCCIGHEPIRHQMSPFCKIWTRSFGGYATLPHWTSITEVSRHFVGMSHEPLQDGAPVHECKWMRTFYSYTSRTR